MGKKAEVKKLRRKFQLEKIEIICATLSTVPAKEE